MRKLLITFIFALASTNAFALVGGPYTARFTIQDFGTIQEKLALNFGSVMIHKDLTAPVSYVLDATTGNVTAGGHTYLVGSATPSEFEISGNPGAAVTISITSNGDLASTTTADTIAATYTPNATNLTLDATTGKGTLLVGGSLQINGTMNNGLYAGLYTVNITY